MPKFNIPDMKMTDSRHRESRTLFFVTVSWVVLLVKFLVEGLTLPMVGEVPSMSVSQFSTGFGAILLVWLGREWTEKVSKPKSEEKSDEGN